jgi:hypothetical protein
MKNGLSDNYFGEEFYTVMFPKYLIASNLKAAMPEATEMSTFLLRSATTSCFCLVAHT